jgi:hypothetical protein
MAPSQLVSPYCIAGFDGRQHQRRISQIVRSHIGDHLILSFGRSQSLSQPRCEAIDGIGKRAVGDLSIAFLKTDWREGIFCKESLGVRCCEIVQNMGNEVVGAPWVPDQTIWRICCHCPFFLGLVLPVYERGCGTEKS